MSFLQDHILAAIVFLPLLGAALGMSFPRDASGLRGLALGIVLIDLALALGAWARFVPEQAGLQLQEHVPWIPSLGIEMALGVDGVSMVLVLLVAFLAPLVLLWGYGSTAAAPQQPRELLVCTLALQSAMLGSFLATDLILFYVFYECMLVPAFLLVGVWGGARAPQAALRFFVMTMAGSLLMLVAIIATAWAVADAGGLTFAWPEVAARLSERSLGGRESWLFLAFALAFAIKTPLFPFHGWLRAYSVAPAGTAVMLSGVLSKVGAFGFLRYALYLFPRAASAFVPAIALLSTLGIVYGALLALTRRDLREVLAYASLSHLGFVVLGLVGMSPLGVAGGVLQMVAHGLSMGGLFLLAGAVCARRGGGDAPLDELGGLAGPMPLCAAALVLLGMASLGLPGLCNFVGEFMVLLASAALDGPTLTVGVAELALLGQGLLAACGLAAVALVAARVLRPGSAAARAGRGTQLLAVSAVATLAVLLVLPQMGPLAGGLLTRTLAGARAASTSFAQPLPLLAAIALLGTVLAAAYTLRALQALLFGPLGDAAMARAADLGGAERLALLPLIAAVVAVGVHPAPLLRTIAPSAAAYAAHFAAHGGPLVPQAVARATP